MKLSRGEVFTAQPKPFRPPHSLQTAYRGKKPLHPVGGGPDAVRRGLRALMVRCENLTLVTNEIFSDGGRYDEATERYLRNLALLNRELAGEADLVTEVVCGLPNVLKGKLP